MESGSSKIFVGKNREGKPLFLSIDNNHRATLDKAITRVKNKNWDYISAVCGLPGSGKSTFAKTSAKYCCHWFDESYIAFDDEEFIRITNEAPEYSSVVLDESYASLNSRTTMTPEFVRIINHLQILRQKHLFIFLCLPNYFDLAKGIAIFRLSHLFVTYADDEGDRGQFLAFGRDEKRKLYVKGNKYMDYNCVHANFKGRFYLNKGIIDENFYDGKKVAHLMDQTKKVEVKSKGLYDRNKIIGTLKYLHHWEIKKLAILFGLAEPTIEEVLAKFKQTDFEPRE